MKNQVFYFGGKKFIRRETIPTGWAKEISFNLPENGKIELFLYRGGREHILHIEKTPSYKGLILMGGIMAIRGYLKTKLQQCQCAIRRPKWGDKVQINSFEDELRATEGMLKGVISSITPLSKSL